MAPRVANNEKEAFGLSNDPVITTLDDLRGQLRSAVAARAVWRMLAGIAGAFWLGLLLDRWLEPTPMMRVAAWGVLLLAALVWFSVKTAPALFVRLSHRQLASLLGDLRPEAADVVMTSLELQDEDGPLAEATRESASRAIERAGKVRAVRPVHELGVVWFASVGLTAVVALALIDSGSFSHYAQRLALSPEPWPRSVLLVAEGFSLNERSGQLERIVVRGEPCEVVVWSDLEEGRIAPRSVWARRREGRSWRAAEALTRVGGPDEGRQRYRLRLEEVIEPVQLHVSGGDHALPALWLMPASRPTITSLSIQCQPPGYLGAKPFTVRASAPRPLPVGSTATVVGVASKRVATVNAVLVDSTGEETLLLGEPGPGPDSFTVSLPTITEASLLRVDVVDSDTIASEAPFEMGVDVTPDDPPTVELGLVGVSRFVTRDALLPLSASVNDDHGVRRVGLTLRHLEQGSEEAEPKRLIDQPVGDRRPHDAPLEVDLLALRSEPAERKVVVDPGDRIVLQASVTDRYDLEPRAPSLSEPITIEIITPEDLLARIGEREAELRRTLEGVISDLKRLEYTLDLKLRREATSDEPQAPSEGWLAERLLETRKARRGVDSVARGALGLRDEVLNNRLDKPSLADRLRSRVAQPLAQTSEGPLGGTEASLQAGGVSESLRLTRESVAALTRVLDRLEARQTYNEVVAMLRGLIRDQRRVNQLTEKERRAEQRRLLFE